MVFQKLKRVWSHNHWTYIPKFSETFPELNKVSYEEMCERWKSLGINFYSEEKTEIRGWVRFTLPFALILFILMFISLPLLFMITGKWTYPNGEKNLILNWFRALRLVHS
jgi:hypothetical protein